MFCYLVCIRRRELRTSDPHVQVRPHDSEKRWHRWFLSWATQLVVPPLQRRALTAFEADEADQTSVKHCFCLLPLES